MARLVYDIIPPQGRSSQNTRSSQKIKKGGNGLGKKSRKIKNGWLFLFLILAVVAGGFIYQKWFSSFRLFVWPKTQIVSAEKEVMIAAQPSSSVKEEVIPAHLITVQKSQQKIFSTTGRTTEGRKATGVIRVYNDYRPPRSLTLRAQTRFLSSSGHYFRSVKKIFLPPAKWVEGKLVPSWSDVQVIAVAEGPDYNIKPDKFSIPGLVGTVYYSKVYGQSFEAMKGGALSSVPQVSQDDLDQARETLKKELSSQAEQALREKIGKDFVLLPSSFSQDFQDGGSSVKVGEKVAHFDYKATVISKAIVFSRTQAKTLVEGFIKKQIGADRELVPGSLMITYHPLAVNFDQQIIDCNLEITAKTYPLIQENSLKQMVAGKALSQALTLLKEHFPQLAEVRGAIQPFWQRKIPADLSRIQVKLYLNY